MLFVFQVYHAVILDCGLPGACPLLSPSLKHAEEFGNFQESKNKQTNQKSIIIDLTINICSYLQ